MKKFSLLMLGTLFCMMLSFTSCNKCSSNNSEAIQDSVELVAETPQVAKLNVEQIVSTDRQSMYMTYGTGDYRWFETCVQLEDFLDDENCDGTVHSVSNVFQVVEEKDNGADVFVVLYSHLTDTAAVDIKHGFWVEDLPMEDEAVTVTFEKAFERLMEANCPKPHSRQCVLRKQLGPVNTNPQYIFGNTRYQVYVDAATGDVNTVNPVFPETKGFKMPLGEWP